MISLLKNGDFPIKNGDVPIVSIIGIITTIIEYNPIILFFSHNKIAWFFITIINHCIFIIII